jgi:hypothetical protein
MATKPTAETILDLINALPKAERRRLIELLEDHPDNMPVIRTKIALEITEEYALTDTVPKRKMMPANQETLRAFERLLKKHGQWRGAQMAAIRELVTLPSEQGKPYVLKYRESRDHDPKGIGDLEAVRQHIKRLRRTARKRPL